MKNLPSMNTCSLNSTLHGGKYYIVYLTRFLFPQYSGHCKKLAPEYVKAAATLAEQDPPLYIAKVDATEHKKLAERFGIKGFPTLHFFV